MVANGGCICGYRQLGEVLELTWSEIVLLKLGWFLLKDWEISDIRPLFPVWGVKLRHAYFNVR